MEYKPVDFLNGGAGQDLSNTALVILNQPISSKAVFKRLWECSQYRLCADGGANRLIELLTTDEAADFLPNIIHGDLDSLRAEVRDYYASKDVPISKNSDQYSTDFGKAMHKIGSLAETSTILQNVLILGGLGGRVDQGLGLLHEMLREQKARSTLRLWLFSERSVSFILDEGENVIHTPLTTGKITKNVGIVPIYGPAIISTTGLEWDVKGWPTSMDSQVSTSNHIVGSSVVVQTDAKVLFTIELAGVGPD